MRYLLVAGIARSGTTALADLLNAHPRTVIGQERYFRLVNDERIGEFTRELFEPARFLHPRPDETHNHSWAGNRRYTDFLAAKMARSVIIGDKVPNYYWYDDIVLSALPDARMLLITRDPLRVADSWKRRMLDPDDTIWTAGADEALLQWNAGHARMVQAARRHAGRIGVVEYEKLYTGDVSSLARLLAWLDAGPANEWMIECFTRATSGWSGRMERALVLDERERETIAETARIDLRHELLALAAI